MMDIIRSSAIAEKAVAYADDGTEDKPGDGPPNCQNTPAVFPADTSIVLGHTGMPLAEIPVEPQLHYNAVNDVVKVLPVYGTWPSDKGQPGPFSEHMSSRLCTSVSKSQQCLKTAIDGSHRDGDPCASVLLACLFCRPLDCVAAVAQGCEGCLLWLCSSMCNYEASSLGPLLDAAPHCDCCCGGTGGPCCGLCPICEVCLQGTECLDLAMEFSQMLFH